MGSARRRLSKIPCSEIPLKLSFVPLETSLSTVCEDNSAKDGLSVKMKRIVTALATAVLVGVVALGATFPTYDYGCRLHLTLEIDGKPYIGSSVIEVSYSCGSKIPDTEGCAGTGRAGHRRRSWFSGNVGSDAGVLAPFVTLMPTLELGGVSLRKCIWE